jgi:tetratricopeptide (TPR) repeat protein
MDMPIFSDRVCRLADGLLILLVAATAFLLGCQDLFDTDVWWHLRAGQWIWAHGKVPDLDPFTFASADRPWIDLHWLFQLMLAAAYALGGVRGMILLAAGLCAGTLLIGLSARDRHWSVWMIILCWLPALLVMSSRFDPRPELVSLMGMAVYLAVLERTDRTPALAWVLPVVQLVWVNAHALFVLGPIFLGAYLVDHVVSLRAGRRWWLHIVGATAAVGLACLINPYGLRGTLFPLELFPKITSWGGLYKSQIAEFSDLREFVAKEGPERAAADFYFCAEGLLLAILPLAFIAPALWQEIRLRTKGRLWRIAALAVVTSAAEATWVFWLGAHLFGSETETDLSILALVCGCAAAALILRSGGRAVSFRLILAAVFSYLAIQAVRNVNLFGLVAGFVMACNLGELAGELAAVVRARWPRASAVAGLAARGALAVGIGLWIIAIISGSFFRSTGEQRRFGLGEMPLAYAHDAARFAGRPGLPGRALVLDLRQAGVYLFHNGPEHQLFMDARLEVPNRSTFEMFVQVGRLLNAGRPGWAELLRQMKDPLVLLDHAEHSGAEATLLAEPGWRCVYFDAIASIFVARRPELDGSFPAVDFAARHFRDSAWRAEASIPKGLGEALALINLNAAVRHRPGLAPSWPFRLSLMLLAGDRFRQALAAGTASDPGGGPAAAGYWSVLGACYWNMIPDLTVAPPGPDGPWDVAPGLLWAQATYCYRQALQLNPGEVGALLSLHDSFKARRMHDAQQEVVDLMRQARSSNGSRAAVKAPAAPTVKGAVERLPAWADRDGLSRAIAELLANGRPAAAVRLFATAGERQIVPSWPASDSVATALLHLGRPAAARRVWERAAEPPSPAVRLARLATAALAALDFPTAEREYRAAIALDPKLGEAQFGLALLFTQLGDAKGAVTAARAALQSSLTLSQNTFMAGIEALAQPSADDRSDSQRK